MPRCVAASAAPASAAARAACAAASPSASATAAVTAASSSRMSASPAATVAPSATGSSATMPPVWKANRLLQRHEDALGGGISAPAGTTSAVAATSGVACPSVSMVTKTVIPQRRGTPAVSSNWMVIG